MLNCCLCWGLYKSVVTCVLLTSSGIYANYKSCSIWVLIYVAPCVVKNIFHSSCLVIAQLLEPPACTHTREQMEQLEVYLMNPKVTSTLHLRSDIHKKMYWSTVLRCFKMTLQVYERDFTASLFQIKHLLQFGLVSVFLISLISRSCRHTPHIETQAFHSCQSFEDSRTPEIRSKILTHSLLTKQKIQNCITWCLQATYITSWQCSVYSIVSDCKMPWSRFWNWLNLSDIVSKAVHSNRNQEQVRRVSASNELKLVCCKSNAAKFHFFGFGSDKSKGIKLRHFQKTQNAETKLYKIKQQVGVWLIKRTAMTGKTGR